MGYEHVGNATDEGAAGRGRIASTLRALAGWGLLGAVAGRWAMRVTSPGTQPDTIRGRVLETHNNVITGLPDVPMSISPAATTSNSPTDAGGNYSFVVGPDVDPVTYTVTANFNPATHVAIPGHPTAVDVVSSSNNTTYTVDFLVKRK